MKKSKKVLAVLLAALTMSFAFVGCGSSTENSGSSNKSEEGKVYNIGICQLVQHDALDTATKGFRDKLTELLGKDNVVFDEKNAAGDSATCSTICNQFVTSKVDLILANATPALQAAMSSTKDIPILGTSVTDYATALNVSDWKGTTGANISGTSDLAPLDGQADMLKELFPDAKKVGIVYCSSEPNSIYQSDTITEYLKKDGYEVSTYTFSDSNDVTSVTTTACSENEVLYIPTDNTAASCTKAINNIALEKKIPIVCGEEGICEGCGVATLSISYYDLGQKTAEMAYDILVNGADISKMEIQSAPKFTKKYNADICKTLGLEIPDDYEAIAAE